MAGRIDSLQELLVQQLRDLFSAETQLIKALPKMANAAHSEELREAIEQHLIETERQLDRLQQVCNTMGVKPRGHKCVAMAGLIREAEEILRGDMDPDVRDAAIICAAQRVEHYEIAAYGCARAFAERLGMSDEAQLLADNLAEEGAADKKFTEIAMSGVNSAAIS